MRLARPLSLVTALSLMVGACSDAPTNPLSAGPRTPTQPRLDGTCSGLILSVSISGPSQIVATKDGNYTVNAVDRDYCPMSTVGHAVTWWITGGATIASSTQESAVVHGVSAGSATLHVVVDGLSASKDITVLAAPYPASVSITPNPARTAVGQYAYFEATSATDQYGDPFPVSQLSWSSSNSAIATINSSSGVATGVSVGTVTISATANGHGGSVQLTIVPAVSISGPEYVESGEFTLTSSVNPSGTYWYDWQEIVCNAEQSCYDPVIIASGYNVTSVTPTMAATDYTRHYVLFIRSAQGAAEINSAGFDVTGGHVAGECGSLVIC